MERQVSLYLPSNYPPNYPGISRLNNEFIQTPNGLYRSYVENNTTPFSPEWERVDTDRSFVGTEFYWRIFLNQDQPDFKIISCRDSRGNYRRPNTTLIQRFWINDNKYCKRRRFFFYCDGKRPCCELEVVLSFFELNKDNGFLIQDEYLAIDRKTYDEALRASWRKRQAQEAGRPSWFWR
jgi:hypothetical protein